MIDDVALSIAPAGEVTVLDLWSGEIDALLAGIPHIQVEPHRWWLFGALPPGDALGDRGALAAIGGGLVRARMTGAGWRTLLAVSGVIDSENPAFTTGAVAASVIHHIPVWIVVTASDACEVYYPASYAATLERLWRDAIGGS